MSRVPIVRVLAAALLIVGLFTMGLAASQLTGPLHLPWRGGPEAGQAGGGEGPTRILIPALAVDAPIEPVDLDAAGGIGSPPLERAHEAGWYRQGPAPGEPGAAIIVGHVDNQHGPAVFYDIPTLQAGQQIEVTRADGQQATFEVTQVRSYPKTNLPPAQVYGDFSTAELRLITCGGRWVGGDTGYEDNVIVFATLVTVG